MTIQEKFDDIASQVNLADRAFDILDLINENDLELFNMPKSRIEAELKGRGLVVANGIVRPHSVREFVDVEKPDYTPFINAAKRVISESDKPVATADLISLVGLGTEHIPMASIAYHLKKHDIFFIVGLGYWHSTQFTDPSGQIMGKRNTEQHFDRISKLFETYGWPLSGRDIERISRGVITSLWMSKYVCRGYLTAAVGIKGGLYVPAGAPKTNPFPMSKNVAEKLIAVKWTTIHEAPENITLNRLFTLLERSGMAVVKRSAASYQRHRVRTFRARLTDEGLSELRKIVSKTHDEF